MRVHPFISIYTIVLFWRVRAAFPRFRALLPPRARRVPRHLWIAPYNNQQLLPGRKTHHFYEVIWASYDLNTFIISVIFQRHFRSLFSCCRIEMKSLIVLSVPLMLFNNYLEHVSCGECNIERPSLSGWL